MKHLLHCTTCTWKSEETSRMILLPIYCSFFPDFSSDANNYACAFRRDQAAKTKHLHNLWRHQCHFVRINETNQNQIKRKWEHTRSQCAKQRQPPADMEDKHAERDKSELQPGA